MFFIYYILDRSSFMIKTKKELKKYLAADFIMNYGEYTLKNRIKCHFEHNLIIKYLKTLRVVEYKKNNHSRLLRLYKIKLEKIGYKTGFSISPNVLGYGVVIPHYGTIVVGPGNSIGKFCVLHTSTCIGGGKRIIGDAFYLSSGAKVFKNKTISSNVSVAANSLLNKDVDIPNALYGGLPAKFIKKADPWYIRDGDFYTNLVKKCEELFKN